MSDLAPRLPPRPSLEQLRKQAKELSRSERVALNQAQFDLARRYGFESWAKLVHHVDAVNQSNRLAPYDRLVQDIVEVGRSNDAEALQRLGDLLGRTYPYPDRRTQLRQYLAVVRGPESRIEDILLADAQLIVARKFGFETWAELAESTARPADTPRSPPLGMSGTPPFYRIDRSNNTIQPRPPLSEEDWDKVFDLMKEMGITGLDTNGQMTDATLARLPQLDQVTRLSLGGSKRLTDDGLLHLARMPHLQELDLSGWDSPITDRGLEVLRHLKDLRRFQMCWPQRISDAGVANLAFCDHLESVDLLGTPTGDGAIRALAGKPTLRRFKSGKQVSDAGLPLLHHFPVFKNWLGGETTYALMSPEAGPTHLLVDGPFTDRGLASLVGLDGLSGLSVFRHSSACTDEGLKVLAVLPHLVVLGWQGERCTDTAMRHIGALPHLRMLMAQGTVASDDGFAALSRSQTIEYIWGRECPNLTGRGFAALAAMPALRGLAVSCRQVDDSALSTLPGFPALRELMPMDVLDEGFRHVGHCKALEALWCMYCRDTSDAATEQIAGLFRLKTYYAGATQITDRSLEILGRMTSLETIEFYETARITNAGLAALAGLPRLRQITVGGSPGVTRDGMAVFPAGVRVDYW